MGNHKVWRKLVKKLRRKRIRRTLAAERNKKLKEEEERLLKDPDYLRWLREQEELEELQREAEQRQHDEEEEKWLRRELLAQKLFREEQKRRQEAENAREKERLMIQKEFEEQKRLAKLRQEEKKRQAEEQERRREQLLQKIKEYIEDNCEMPEEFKQSADTNPGKEICPFFSKTASCRFGDKCSRNHSRPGISRILLLPHFFHHIRLDQSKNTEYGSDFALEYSDDELNNDYKEFFEDVVPELETYGTLQNFRACSNCEPHLRGNVYVEYAEERDAVRAYFRLQGRYYAGKRINVEFATISSWKAAICGLSLSRRCPKGKTCNFLHIFKNPQNKYNSVMCSDSSARSDRSKSKKDFHDGRDLSWNNLEDDASQKRNWRWSETPERSPVVKESSCRVQRYNSRGKSRSASKEKTSRSRSKKTQSERNIRRSRSKSRSRSSRYSRNRSRSKSSEKSFRKRHRKGSRSSSKRDRFSRDRKRSSSPSKEGSLFRNSSTSRDRKVSRRSKSKSCSPKPKSRRRKKKVKR